MWGSKLLKHGGNLAKSILEFDVRVRSSPTDFFIILLRKKISDWVLLSPYIKQVNDSGSLNNWSKTSHSSPSFLQNNIFCNGVVHQAFQIKSFFLRFFWCSRLALRNHTGATQKTNFITDVLLVGFARSPTWFTKFPVRIVLLFTSDKPNGTSNLE